MTHIVTAGLSVYDVDADLLRALRPDFIVTQTQCAVCALTPRDLDDAVCAWTVVAPALSRNRTTSAMSGAIFGRSATRSAFPERAEKVVSGLQERLAGLRGRVAGRKRPRAAAVEGIDPLMACGNWMPELIEIAGGESLFAHAGQHSPYMAWADLVAADPDAIVVLPCGFRIEQTLRDLPALTGRHDWTSLRAVRQGRVALIDGHHYFNRPGPRLVESAEILAEVLHPDLGDFGHRGAGWVPLEAAMV